MPESPEFMLSQKQANKTISRKLKNKVANGQFMCGKALNVSNQGMKTWKT